MNTVAESVGPTFEQTAAAAEIAGEVVERLRPALEAVIIQRLALGQPGPVPYSGVVHIGSGGAARGVLELPAVLPGTLRLMQRFACGRRRRRR